MSAALVITGAFAFLAVLAAIAAVALCRAAGKGGDP